MPEETIGSAIVEIQPDFSQFEAQLTRGLQDAVNKAQKNVRVQLKVDESAKSTKGMEQTITSTQVASAELNRTLQEMNKTLQNLSRNMRESRSQGQGALSTFSSLVLTFANLGNAARGAFAIVDFVTKFRAGLKPLQGNLFGVATGFARVKEVANLFAKTLADVGTSLSSQINTNNRVARAVTDVGNAYQKTGRQIKNVVGGSNAVNTATQQTAKASTNAATAVNNLGAAHSKTSFAARFFREETGAANLGLITGASAANKISAAFTALGERFRRNRTESVASVDGVTRLNNAFLRLSKGLERSSNNFAKFAFASKFAQRVFKTAVVETVKNADDIAAAAFRANKALGGVFGGPKFAFEVSSTIGLVSALVTVLGAGSGAIVAFAQKASNANESINALNVLLGKEAGTAFKTMVGDTTALGLSATKLRTSINPIIPLLKDAGLTGDELAGSLNDIVRRAVDLSSVFNVDVSHAIGNIASAIRGETEPIRSLGISFNAAEVEAKALSLGFAEVAGQIPEAAKQVARLQIIMDKSSDSANDFANTADGLANLQRILGAKIETLVGAISASFLPAAQKIVTTFIKLTEDNGPKLTDLFATLTPLITKFADLFASVYGVLSKVGGIWAGLIIPTLKVFMQLLDTVSPVFIAFLEKFLILKAVSLTIKIFAAALALLPSAINGVSVATATLATSVSSFLRPLALVTLSLGLFSSATQSMSASGGVLSAFGTALKVIEPILRVILFRFLALQAVPLIVAGIKGALTQLSPQLALTATATTRLTAGLTAIAGPIGLALTAFTLLKTGVRDAAAEIAGLDDATAKVSLDKIVDLGEANLAEKTLTEFAPREFLRSFGDNLTLGILDLSEDAAVNAKKGAENVKKAFAEQFKLDPAKATAVVVEAERKRLPIAAALRTQLLALTEAEAARTRSLQTSATVLADRITLEGKLFEAFSKQKTGVESLIAASSAVVSANKTLAAASKTAADATKALKAIEEERIQVLRDTISPLQEITDAEEALTRIGWRLRDLAQEQIDIEAELLDLRTTSAQEFMDAQEALLRIGWRLRDLDQEEIDLTQQLKDLKAPASADDLAAADRTVERAKIALAKATRDEAEALKELIAEQETSIDLTGLSLDGLRSTLAGARASAAAQRAATKKTGKTQVEIDEELLGNKLTTLDAAQALKDAEEERDKLRNRELLNGPQIRETEERLVELGIDRADALVDQETARAGEVGVDTQIRGLEERLSELALDRKDALYDQTVSQTALNLLKGGETTLSLELTRLEEAKKTALQEQKTAAEGVKTAKDLVLIASRELDVIEARIEGNMQDEITAEMTLLELKATQAGLDRDSRDYIQQQLNDLRLQGALPLRPVVPAPVVPAQLAGSNFANIVGSGLVGGLADQAITAMARALMETQELKTFVTSGGAIARFQGGIVEGAPGAAGQLVRAGEFGYSELVLPFQRDPKRSAQLLSQFAPGVIDLIGNNAEGLPPILDALRRIHLPSRGPSAPLNLSIPQGVRTASSGVSSEAASRKGNKALAVAIVAEMKEAGFTGGGITVEAPITVSSPVEDPRLLVRELERKILKKRRR